MKRFYISILVMLSMAMTFVSCEDNIDCSIIGAWSLNNIDPEVADVIVTFGSDCIGEVTLRSTPLAPAPRFTYQYINTAPDRGILTIERVQSPADYPGYPAGCPAFRAGTYHVLITGSDALHITDCDNKENTWYMTRHQHSTH